MLFIGFGTLILLFVLGQFVFPSGKRGKSNKFTVTFSKGNCENLYRKIDDNFVKIPEGAVKVVVENGQPCQKPTDLYEGEYPGFTLLRFWTTSDSEPVLYNFSQPVIQDISLEPLS